MSEHFSATDFANLSQQQRADELERQRLLIAQERLEEDKRERAGNQRPGWRYVGQVLAGAVTFTGLVVSAANVGVAYIQKGQELKVAQNQKERELELAREHKEKSSNSKREAESRIRAVDPGVHLQVEARHASVRRQA